jgi:hypothetical protein
MKPVWHKISKMIWEYTAHISDKEQRRKTFAKHMLPLLDKYRHIDTVIL